MPRFGQKGDLKIHFLVPYEFWIFVICYSFSIINGLSVAILQQINDEDGRLKSWPKA